MRKRVAAAIFTLSLGAAAIALAQLAPGERPIGQAAPDTPAREGQPIETRSPNAVTQRPAFREQTRAPYAKTRAAFEVSPIAAGLKNPWGIDFLPDGRVLISHRDGTLRIVGRDGAVGPAIAGPPDNYLGGDSGVDIVLDTDFSASRRLFIAYVEQRNEGTGLSLASATLSADESRLENVSVLLRTEASPVAAHYGGRLSLGPDGNLYLTSGSRFSAANRVKAQDLSSTWGKVLRVDKAGKPAPGNPFAGRPGARAEIWALGVRNPQGLAWQPGTGALWESEHGQQGGDELNRLQAGGNYGWPVIAYGLEYNNTPINGGKSQEAGMEQPVYYYDPVISPSGITFYSGRLIPEWRGNLFVAGLAGRHLARLVIRNGKVVGEERLLLDLKHRIRDVAEGPDGALWVIEDGRGLESASLLRIGPKP